MSSPIIIDDGDDAERILQELDAQEKIQREKARLQERNYKKIRKQKEFCKKRSKLKLQHESKQWTMLVA